MVDSVVDRSNDRSTCSWIATTQACWSLKVTPWKPAESATHVIARRTKSLLGLRYCIGTICVEEPSQGLFPARNHGRSLRLSIHGCRIPLGVPIDSSIRSIAIGSEEFERPEAETSPRIATYAQPAEAPSFSTSAFHPCSDSAGSKAPFAVSARDWLRRSRSRCRRHPCGRSAGAIASTDGLPSATWDR